MPARRTLENANESVGRSCSDAGGAVAHRIGPDRALSCIMGQGA